MKRSIFNIWTYNGAILRRCFETSKFFCIFLLIWFHFVSKSGDPLSLYPQKSITMIQRVQSLYLLASAMIAIALFWIPFSEFTVPASDGSQAKVSLTLLELRGTDQSSSTLYQLLVLNLLILSGSLYTIFLYKNRLSQIRITTLTSLLSVLLMILAFYTSDRLCPEGVRPHYLSGIYLLAAQVLCLLLARRAIRKDEKLIRSANRIR